MIPSIAHLWVNDRCPAVVFLTALCTINGKYDEYAAALLPTTGDLFRVEIAQ